MGNLMPHLLPEVVPLIAQPLVDYLVERCREHRRKPAGARRRMGPREARPGAGGAKAMRGYLTRSSVFRVASSTLWSMGFWKIPARPSSLASML